MHTPKLAPAADILLPKYPPLLQLGHHDLRQDAVKFYTSKVSDTDIGYRPPGYAK